MKNNLDYWRDVYFTDAVPVYPSQFAVFVQSWLAGNLCNIIEVGCGNGRDSLFFGSMGHKVVATDQCINDNLKELELNSQVSFIEKDITESAAELVDNLDPTLDTVVYSRFFQHAINEKAEESMLSRLQECLPEKAILFFEFRLFEDRDSPKVFGVEHYRRFQTDEEFKSRLRRHGFVCEYAHKGRGFARYGAEDPVVGRFVARLENERILRVV